jgi:NADH:ubiquinone oxidoreductase subunit 4 (subunit M)
VVLVPLVALAIFMGIASPLITRTIEPSMDNLIRQVQKTRRVAPVAAPAVATDQRTGPGARE